jgi:hypothetical protein
VTNDLSIQITGGLRPARRRGFLLLDRAERNPVNWWKLPANRENVMNYLSTLVLMVAALPAQEAKETAAEAEVKRLAVPEKLMPKGKSLLFLLRAEGEQVYRAEKKGDKLAWVFQEPDASSGTTGPARRPGPTARVRSGLTAVGARSTRRSSRASPHPDQAPWPGCCSR